MSHSHHPPHHPPPHHPPHHPPHKPPHSEPNKIAVIKNVKSGLVLDASEYEVKLQKVTGFPAQLWTLEPMANGSYIFINKGTGNALDIQGGVKDGSNLITYGKHGLQNQQWTLNPDGTITNGSLAVDISRENFKAGSQIIAYRKHGKANQTFKLEYQ